MWLAATVNGCCRMSEGDEEPRLGGSWCARLTHRAFLFLVLSGSHSVYNNLFTSSFYHFLIHCVYFTSSSISIPPCAFLCEAQTWVYLLEFLISCLGCVSDHLFSCPAHIKHPSCSDPERRLNWRTHIYCM